MSTVKAKSRPVRAGKSIGLREFINACFICLAACSALTYAAHIHWSFDLLTSFRVQYAVLWGLGVIYFLLSRSIRIALVAALFSGSELYWVLPYLQGSGRSAATTSREANPEAFRVGAINVNAANLKTELVIAEVQHWSPDVILFTEVDQRWLRALAPLEEQFPYSSNALAHNNFGIALYSKHPLEDLRLFGLGSAGVTTVSGTVELSGKKVLLIGAHLLPPMSGRGAQERNQALLELQKYVPAGHVLVLGDLNITAFSPYFRDFLQATKLQDSALNQPWQPTWPSGFLPPAITIDHCLYSAGFSLIQRARGRHVGSDHLPIFADFTLTR